MTYFGSSLVRSPVFSTVYFGLVLYCSERGRRQRDVLCVLCYVVSARTCCLALQYRRCLLKSTFSGGAQAAMMEGGRVQWVVWMCDCGTTWAWLLGHRPPLWGSKKRESLGQVEAAFLALPRVIAVAIVDRPLLLLSNQIKISMADGILIWKLQLCLLVSIQDTPEAFGINLTTIGPMRKNAGH